MENHVSKISCTYSQNKPNLIKFPYVQLEFWINYEFVKMYYMYIR